MMPLNTLEHIFNKVLVNYIFELSLHFEDLFEGLALGILWYVSSSDGSLFLLY